MSGPVIALVGRPNVGKSTLFNVLTRSRSALVADMPGVTRDRIYGQGNHEGRKFIVVDTGGLSYETEGVAAVMAEQSWVATEEADAILFVVDARDGIHVDDEKIARALRALNKPLFLVVNKSENLEPEVAAADFYRLGLGEPTPVSAAHHRGIQTLIEAVLRKLPEAPEVTENAEEVGTKIALIGRPNVGKSTLTNRMLGEDRVVVFDLPGTTRDSIYVPMERHGKRYTLIDTAGVRRKGKVGEGLEKFSVIKTLKAIEDAHVVLMVFDAQEGVTEQDLHILGFAVDAGRGLVLAVNKWDDLDPDKRHMAKMSADRRLRFVSDFVDVHYISALHGSGVGLLFKSVDQAYESANKQLSTSGVTRALEDAVAEHNPPLVKSRRVKLRYAHVGGHNPPLIIIHGNQVESLPDAYKKYLMGCFRKAFKLHGTPIRLEFKSSENPFKDKKNELTARQAAKKRRMMQHVKKAKQ